MRKKLLALLTGLLLVLQCVVFPAAAAGTGNASVSVVSARCTGSSVYCYVLPNDPELDISAVSIGAVAENFQGGEMQTPKQVAGSGFRSGYLLLIDTSASMSANRQKLTAFSDALLAEEQQEVSVTVAGFGASFEVVAEDLTDPEQVRQTIDGLSYEQEVSDINGAVTQALAYLSGHTAAGGELCSLVVLTDGETYMSGTGTAVPAIRRAAAEAKEAIESTPEVVVHTVGLGQWESLTYAALSTGTGLDLTVRSNTGAAAAGEQLARFTDGLYYVNIPFTATQNVEFVDAQLMLTFGSPDDLEFIPLDHLRNLSYIDAGGMSTQPGDGEGGAPEDGEEEAPSGDTPEPDSGEAETAGDTPGEETGEEDGETDEASGEEDITASDEDGLPEREEEGDAEEQAGTPWALIAVGAAVLVALALVIGVLLGRGRKAKPLPVTARQEDGVWIRLEMLSGNSVTGRLEYPIGGGLVIGSDPACAVVFPDATVLARNSQIYMRGGVVYIEDMNPASNTSVGGMKIHMPNRLRDGDEVAVGKVRFRVRFLRVEGS